MAKILMILIVLLLPGPTMAGLDYVCLQQCKGRGSDNTSCVKECTLRESNSAQVTSEALEAGSARNKQFDAPTKSEGIVIAPQETPKPQLNTDYVCLQGCLQEKLQYSFCQIRCQKAASTVPNAGR